MKSGRMEGRKRVEVIAGETSVEKQEGGAGGNCEWRDCKVGWVREKGGWRGVGEKRRKEEWGWRVGRMKEDNFNP